MIDDDDYGAISGIIDDRGNRSTLRIPAPVLLFHHKSHLIRPELERGPPRWEAGD
jgi:hypothetical protein